jgi:hypothetical protein
MQSKNFSALPSAVAAVRPGCSPLLAGFPHQSSLTAALRSEISATPIVVCRLQRLAREIGFPEEEIFTDAREAVR